MHMLTKKISKISLMDSSIPNEVLNIYMGMVSKISSALVFKVSTMLVTMH